MPEHAVPVAAPHGHRPPAVRAASGQPLEPAAAARFGAAFGCDFSGVRVHTGSAASRSADRRNALAYAVGSDIAFATGQYAPAGDRLLAHELAHVAQQVRGGGAGHVEVDADRAAEAVLRGESYRVTGAPLAVACQNRSATVHAHSADVAVLQEIMHDLLESLPEGTRRTVETNKTVAIAVVQDSEGFRTLLYTVSGNWTSKEFAEAAAKFNLTRVNPNPRAAGRGDTGAPSDAEQLMFEAVDENAFELETMVTSRDFCVDCAEAVRAEITPRGGRSGGSGGGRTESRTEIGTPERAVNEATPGLNPAHGAMEGAALMINQGLARIATQQQLELARQALADKQPEIDRMRREGKWVIASVVMNEPRQVDLLKDIVTTPDQIATFGYVATRWGSTRDEADHPPQRFEAAPPGRTQTLWHDPLPETRRYHSYDVATYPPIQRQSPTDERVRRLGAMVRNAEVFRRFLELVTAVRNPAAAHTPAALQGLMAPFDPRNPTVLDDMAIGVAILGVGGRDLALIVAAFPGVLRSGAQVRADRAAGR